MKVQLAQQPQERLGQSDVVMITERVDDVALLIGQMVQMGLPASLDRHIPHHWTQRGLSGGWTAVMWLAYMLTEGAHRNVSMATSRKGMPHTLRRRTARVIAPLDVSDDRLRPLLRHRSKPTSWHQIAHDVQTRSLAVHALPQDVHRCEATTVSGEHEVTAGGLWQCGHRQEDPTRPQSKVLMGSLEPLGMPLATEVVSGDRADDGVYRPIIERMRSGLNQPGLRCVGDGQRSALDTRASRARHQDWYVSPWPLTGATAEAMDAWSTAGVAQSEAGTFGRRGRTADRGPAGLAAEGYACARTGCAPIGGLAWSARVLVVRSPMHATPQAAGLATRLRHAETNLAALTPPRGRGKRQMTDEATRVEAMGLVLQEHRVDGWLRVPWAKQGEQTTQYVGRGRGAVHRAKRVLQQTRSHITHIARQGDTIAALRPRFGWKVCVTNARQTRRSWQEAVVCSRHAYRVERLCNRLKSRGHSAPLFVKRNEHIEALPSLLTLGVRVLTVTEFVLRRSLEQAQVRLLGVHPEHKHKRTDTPTAERLLKALADIALTIITHAAGEDILRHLTPLSGLQEDILQRLGVGAALSRQLEIQAIGH